MVLGLGFAGPLLVLLLRSRDSVMVRQHAVGAVNFNITVGLVGLVSLLSTAALARNGSDQGPGRGGGPDWASGLAVSVLVLLTVYWFLFTVRAAMTARYGERCRYPPSLPILRV
jgi:uncharacterized Tic20 family protein